VTPDRGREAAWPTGRTEVQVGALSKSDGTKSASAAS